MDIATPNILSNEHIKGDWNAPITLLEYGDFECPYCLNAKWIVEDLLRAFPRQLKFVFRHFPNTQMHPKAMTCAMAADAAGRQGKFWQMHDEMFHNASSLDRRLLFQIAVKLNLDMEAFTRDIVNQEYQREIELQVREAQEILKVTGTPTFFINGGRKTTNWKTENLMREIKIVQQNLQEVSG